MNGSSSAQLENRFYELYIDFFNRAEAERRWNVQKDIPWDKCNPKVSDAIALIVESFCAVELFLPDYTSKILQLIRKSRGRAWFQANWGYEESKHSLVLEEWLVRSGKRSVKEVRDSACRRRISSPIGKCAGKPLFGKRFFRTGFFTKTSCGRS